MEIASLVSTKDKTIARLKKSVLSSGVSPITFAQFLTPNSATATGAQKIAQAEAKPADRPKEVDRPNAHTDSTRKDSAPRPETGGETKANAKDGLDGEAKALPGSESGGNGKGTAKGNPDGKTAAETAASKGAGQDGESGTVVKALQGGGEGTVEKTTLQQIIQNAGLTGGLEIVAEGPNGQTPVLASAAAGAIAQQAKGAKAAETSAAPVQPGQIAATEAVKPGQGQTGSELRTHLNADLSARAALAGTETTPGQNGQAGTGKAANGQAQTLIQGNGETQTHQGQTNQPQANLAAGQAQTETRRGGETVRGPDTVTQVTAASGRSTGVIADAAANLDALRSGRPAAQPSPVTDQVAVRISKAVADGLDRINIQLRPAALGRVSVSMELGHDGRIQAVVTADNTGTLDMLKQDARALEKALAEAGLKTDSGSLSFNLRGQEKGGDGAGGNAGGFDTPGPDTGGEEIEIKLRERPSGGTGLLDIHV